MDAKEILAVEKDYRENPEKYPNRLEGLEITFDIVDLEKYFLDNRTTTIGMACDGNCCPVQHYLVDRTGTPYWQVGNTFVISPLSKKYYYAQAVMEVLVNKIDTYLDGTPVTGAICLMMLSKAARFTGLVLHSRNGYYLPHMQIMVCEVCVPMYLNHLNLREPLPTPIMYTCATCHHPIERKES